jgi:uncharacterized protein
VNQRMTGRALLTISALSAMSICVYAAGSSGSGSVSITSPSGFSENFAGLSNSTSPSSALPAGWYLTESNTGGAADGLYVVGTGSSMSGGAYSFGAASALDRALGSLGSGTVTPIQYGAQLTNNTGSVITSINVAYWGEMWRRGSTTAAAGEGLTFAYSLDATSLTSGTFTVVPGLAFNSPRDACSATPNVATVGNNSECRQLITATISGLTVASGQTVWIRWTDVDTASSDDGMAIDDVTISVSTDAISIDPTATGSASPNPAAPGQLTTLSGTITSGQNPASASFAVSCNLTAIGGSAAQSLPVTAATFSGTTTIAPGTAPSAYALPCTVVDDQQRSSNFNINLTVAIPPNATCGAPATPINAVQGPGATSPLVGQQVDVEGIVIADLQGSSLLNGFYLQEPLATQDGSALTSEGLFVFANSPAVNVGDRVRIRGTVAEFSTNTGAAVSNLTELSSTSNGTVCSTGNPLPTPVTLTLPVDSLADFERVEGMLVQLPQQLVVTGNFSLGQFGQIDIAPEVLYQPTQTPGGVATWTPLADLNRRSRIALDDNSTSSNTNLNGGGVAPV